MLNSLAWAIGVLVDGAIIGRHLGVDAMAAYGMIWPLTLIYGLIGAVFSGGSRNLYSNLAGHGRLEEANGVFTLACVAAVLLSVLAASATACFASPLAGLLGANGGNENLRPLIVLYLQGFVIGLPFDSMGRILAAYLGMDSDYRRAFAATLAMTVADIIGDFAAVYLFDGSMFLIGLTTAIGQMVYCAVLSTHFLRKKRMLHYTFRRLGGALKHFGGIISHGIPAGLTRLFGAVSSIAVNQMIAAAASSAYIAAYGIGRCL